MALKPAEDVLPRAVLNVGKVKERLLDEDEMISRVNDMFNDPEFDKKRREATLELLKLLTDLVQKHPEQRFGQILQNYGFVKQTRPINPETAAQFRVEWQNEFYEEPTRVLKRVRSRLSLDDIENPKG